MRIKLSIVAGVISFTVAGIAAAAQSTSIFTSSANPLSTIGELVATSLWDANNPDAKTVTAATTANFVATVKPGKILSSAFSSLPNSQIKTIPSVNLQAPDFTQINSIETVGDSGSPENNNITGGSSNNSFSGVSGGGVNWGSASSTKLYYFPGTLTGVSSSGGLPVTGSVPEPGEWLQMILGFGLVGIFAIYRKQKIIFEDA